MAEIKAAKVFQLEIHRLRCSCVCALTKKFSFFANIRSAENSRLTNIRVLSLPTSSCGEVAVVSIEEFRLLFLSRRLHRRFFGIRGECGSVASASQSAGPRQVATV